MAENFFSSNNWNSRLWIVSFRILFYILRHIPNRIALWLKAFLQNEERSEPNMLIFQNKIWPITYWKYYHECGRLHFYLEWKFICINRNFFIKVIRDTYVLWFVRNFDERNCVHLGLDDGVVWRLIACFTILIKSQSEGSQTFLRKK